MPGSAGPAVSVSARDDRRGATLRLAIVSAAFAVALILPRAIVLPGVPMCAFRLWTGLPCPGCGMTRATFSLAHADLSAALRFHPLVLVFAALATGTAAGALWALGTGRDPVWRFLDRHSSKVAAGLVVALLGVWVVRVILVPAWSPDPIVGRVSAPR